MKKIRCLSCHSIMNEKNSCPVCGCTEYAVFEKDGAYCRSLDPITEADIKSGRIPADFSQMKSWADDYRREKLDKIDVCLKIYTRKLQADESIKETAQSVTLFSAKLLEFGTVLWSDKIFARNIRDKKIELTVEIAKGNNTLNTTVISCQVPELEDFWKIGAVLDENLCVRLVIGNEMCNTVSDRISLS